MYISRAWRTFTTVMTGVFAFSAYDTQGYQETGDIGSTDVHLYVGAYAGYVGTNVSNVFLSDVADGTILDPFIPQEAFSLTWDQGGGVYAPVTNTINTIVAYDRLMPGFSSAGPVVGVSLGAVKFSHHFYTNMRADISAWKHTEAKCAIPITESAVFTLRDIVPATPTTPADFRDETVFPFTQVSSYDYQMPYISRGNIDVMVGGGIKFRHMTIGGNIGWAYTYGELVFPQLQSSSTAQDANAILLSDTSMKKNFHGLLVALEGAMEISRNVALTMTLKKRFFKSRTFEVPVLSKAIVGQCDVQPIATSTVFLPAPTTYALSGPMDSLHTLAGEKVSMRLSLGEVEASVGLRFML